MACHPVLKRFSCIAFLGVTLATAVSGAPTDEWSDREVRILKSLSLNSLVEAPVSPSNQYADNEAAAALGKRLFFETRLSGSGELSCATCHQPSQYFTDGLARSKGAGLVMRNAPTIIGAAYNRWFYWDGRRDSLWAQALIPIEAPDEMDSNRVATLRFLAGDQDYRESYQAVFEQALDLELLSSLPDAGPFAEANAKKAWSALSREERLSINRAYSNIGKAIAAYEHTLLPSPMRLDEYVANVLRGVDEVIHLTPDEKAGARLFFDSNRTQCLQCHNGPLLTNGEFHNIGTGNFSGEGLDFGRSIGLRAVLMDEFNCLGPYSDAQAHECRELIYLNQDSHLPLRGAFKVPSLRALRHTAPYFHDGRFTTLQEVLEYYNSSPAAEDVGPHELRPMNLTDSELGQLEVFLLTLSD